MVATFVNTIAMRVRVSMMVIAISLVFVITIFIICKLFTKINKYYSFIIVVFIAPKLKFCFLKFTMQKLINIEHGFVVEQYK